MRIVEDSGEPFVLDGGQSASESSRSTEIVRSPQRDGYACRIRELSRAEDDSIDDSRLIAR